MKIILTQTFLNTFKKDFRKYNFSIDELVVKLKKQTPTSLDFPFYKVELFLNGVAIRGIVVLNDNKKPIPLIFFLKKEKSFGENLFLTKEVLKKLDTLMKKFSQDFGEEDYFEF